MSAKVRLQHERLFHRHTGSHPQRSRPSNEEDGVDSVRQSRRQLADRHRAIQQAEKPISNSFQMTHGSFYGGDIALDDVAFSGCDPSFKPPKCTKNQLRCTNKWCVDLSQKCDFTDDCGDGSDEMGCSGEYSALSLSSK